MKELNMRIATSTGFFITRHRDEQVEYTRKHRIGKFQLEQALEALNELYTTKVGQFQLTNTGGWYNLSWVRSDVKSSDMNFGTFTTKRLYFMMAYAVWWGCDNVNVVALLKSASRYNLSRYGIGSEHLKSGAL